MATKSTERAWATQRREQDASRQAADRGGDRARHAHGRLAPGPGQPFRDHTEERTGMLAAGRDRDAGRARTSCRRARRHGGGRPAWPGEAPTAGRPRRSWYAPRPAAAAATSRSLRLPPRESAMPRAPGTETISKRLEAERVPTAGARAAHPRRRPGGTRSWRCPGPSAARGRPRRTDRRCAPPPPRPWRRRRRGEVAGGAGQVERHRDRAGTAADRTVRQLIEAVDRGTGALVAGSGRGVWRLGRLRLRAPPPAPARHRASTPRATCRPCRR